MLDPDEIRKWLSEAFPSDVIVVEGDGHHFEAKIVSERFQGLDRLKRHRLVYGALGRKVGAEIHALSLKTLTSQEDREH